MSKTCLLGSLLFVVVLAGGCVGSAVTEGCAQKCGDVCLSASACAADIVCPTGSVCDPCTGQCSSAKADAPNDDLGEHPQQSTGAVDMALAWSADDMAHASPDLAPGNPCATNHGGCAAIATCTASGAAAICNCPSGYVSSDAGHTCNDVNECGIANGGCAQKCANTVGGFACSCNAGYTLAADGHSCNDVDECAAGTDTCGATSICTNTVGSYTCACESGFTGDATGRNCHDIDECLTNNGGCGTQKDCTNTQGSYTCTCHQGLVAQGSGCALVACGYPDYENYGYFYSDPDTAAPLGTLQMVCGCLPPEASTNSSNNYWGLCSDPSVSAHCPADMRVSTCWTHIATLPAGCTSSPCLEDCGPGWENIGTFTCDANKNQMQKVCDCHPPLYNNTNYWATLGGGCYLHYTGRSGSPWCP